MSTKKQNIYKVVFPFELPSFNEIIDAAKDPVKTKNGWLTSKDGKPITGFRYKSLKSKTEKKMVPFVDLDLSQIRITGNCAVHVRFYCKDKRKDPPNINAGTKFVYDILQTCEILPNDNWTYLSGGFLYNFFIDKKNPRVEVYILENYNLTIKIEP